MTDKQIIIDGCDVSGCPYYIHKDGSCSSHDCECVKCVHNVCIYKDYKAKEQEVDVLKAENEELEKWKKEHLKDVEFIERNPVIDILNSMADNILLEQRNEKLKQTLDKIKTFVQKEIEYFDHDPEYQYDWKELMGLIKASEVDDESYLDNHWLFTENKKGEN